MIILSIETSCDETAVSIVKAEGGLESPSFDVLGNGLYSQVALHVPYGGVIPNIAKREHGKNLVPLLEKSLKEADFLNSKPKIKIPKQITKSQIIHLKAILEREEGLFEKLKPFLDQYDRPPVDAIAVTAGPGLEPALWVGISFAKALGLAWNIPIVAVNHMEGHIASVLLNKTEEIENSKFQFPKSTKDESRRIDFPAIALLISGGHTEIVLIEQWGKYKILGQTRDDAVGEAFDKVARMLGLLYPGGPQISRLAESARTDTDKIKLPRPMIHSNDLDFSFSGLKTAVLYKIRELGELNDETKKQIAREFQDAVVDVLISKTEKALMETYAKSLIVAGGVIANKKIREAFLDLIEQKYPETVIYIPETELATDNSIMIAMAGYIETLVHPELLTNNSVIVAEGNLKF